MNRILKLIIGILVTLILIFLMAGLFVPKVSYSTSVTVNKPLQVTWEQFNDRGAIQNWIPEVQHIKILKETPQVIGSQYQMYVDSGKGEIIMTETVTEFVPPEKVGLEYNAGQMLKRDKFSFSGDTTTTTISGTHICRGSNYIHRCLFAFFKGMFRNTDQKYLDQFRDWTENQ